MQSYGFPVRRKKRTHKCIYCGKEFETIFARKKCCDSPECKIKQQLSYKSTQQRYKSIRKSTTK